MNHGTNVKPAATLPLHPFHGARWTPHPFFVDIQSRCRRTLPSRMNRIDHSPREFHFIMPREEAGIPHNGVEQQPLVRIRQFAWRIVLKTEVQIALSHFHPRVGNFRLKMEAESASFGWICTTNLIRTDHFIGTPVCEEHLRRLTKLNHDLRRATRHCFPAAQVERHAVPTPIVHSHA